MKRYVTIGTVLIVLQLIVCETSEAQTFSVENLSVDVGGGVPFADDILSPALPPAVVLNGINIDPVTGGPIDVDGFTFGRVADIDLQQAIIDFSVDGTSVGVAASGVSVEFTLGGVGEQNYDVYWSGQLGSNIQIHDGNGLPPGGVVSPFGMFEPQVLGLLTTDPGVDGYDSRSDPGELIYWTWENRASLPPPGTLSGADVMVSPAIPAYDIVPPAVSFAPAAALGLDLQGPNTDNIDALEVFDFGTIGLFEPGLDVILFSLDALSPALALPATPADVLISSGGGTFSVLVPEALLGLAPGDNLTALSVDPASELPVELGLLEATTSGTVVLLRWETASENDNAGFSVEGHRAEVKGERSPTRRSTSEDGWQELGFVEGHGTTSEAQTYTFRTRDLEPGTWNFRLKQIDFDGTFEYSETVEATVTLPGQYVLQAAYPNPFNPSTTIRFAVASEQSVTMTLSDATGRVVRTLYSGTPSADEMQSVRIDANRLASGIYVVRLTGEGFVATEMVTLLR